MIHRARVFPFNFEKLCFILQRPRANAKSLESKIENDPLFSPEQFLLHLWRILLCSNSKRISRSLVFRFSFPLIVLAESSIWGVGLWRSRSCRTSINSTEEGRNYSTEEGRGRSVWLRCTRAELTIIAKIENINWT